MSLTSSPFALEVPETLAIIAGSGAYPQLLARGARAAGVKRIVVAAFENETDPAFAATVDDVEWMRVGQLGKLLRFLERSGVQHVVMAGQIAPKNLFDLVPDLKTLMVLAGLKRRNAESLFGAVASEMEALGATVLPATTFMEEHLAPVGHIMGPKVRKRVEDDLQYGFAIAKETSKLDIGQTVVIRDGTVLAVEAFEGTNAALKRGGELGKGKAIMVKVSKPRQDLRFDVPVIGPLTLAAAEQARVLVIGVEAGKTLLLERERMKEIAERERIAVYGMGDGARTES